MRYQPPPLLRNVAGACFSNLRSATFEDFRFDAESFAGVECPKLKEVQLYLTNHTHENQRSRWQDKRPIFSYATAEGAAKRAAVTKPLEDSADGPVKCSWLKPEKKPATPT